MIGPWKVQFKNSDITTEAEIKALTMIDRDSGWPEFVAAKNATSAHIAELFDREWLCLYPRPRILIHDNGGQFNGF